MRAANIFKANIEEPFAEVIEALAPFRAAPNDRVTLHPEERPFAVIILPAAKISPEL